jgi:NAD(P)-dependent dehydrogenase (short-subunit alcohol dehydrogenase family)
MSNVWDLFRLKESVAIVTGGAGKLGGQMADALAEAGAHVVVASRNLDKCRAKAGALSSAHAEALGVAVDVTSQESVRGMIDAVMQRFGRIDILINNAYSAQAKPFEQMSAEEFESASRGALTSTFLCSQAVAPAMRAQHNGAIVNIASIYGLVSPDHRIYGRSGLDNPCNYGPAKAGVIQFTRWLAAYLAPDGIRVNAITPGGFYNPQFRERLDYEDVFVANYQHKTPLGRMGNETDLKGAVVFLSSAASEYVTGQNLVVDGGWTIW